jgi:hypothetical protein
LDLLGLESFETQEMYPRALLEFGHRVRGTSHFSVMARLRGFATRPVPKHSVGHRTDSSFWLCSENLRRPDTAPTADDYSNFWTALYFHVGRDRMWLSGRVPFLL